MLGLVRSVRDALVVTFTEVSMRGGSCRFPCFALVLFRFCVDSKFCSVISFYRKVGLLDSSWRSLLYGIFGRCSKIQVTATANFGAAQKVNVVPSVAQR